MVSVEGEKKRKIYFSFIWGARRKNIVVVQLDWSKYIFDIFLHSSYINKSETWKKIESFG